MTEQFGSTHKEKLSKDTCLSREIYKIGVLGSGFGVLSVSIEFLFAQYAKLMLKISSYRIIFFGMLSNFNEITEISFVYQECFRIIGFDELF